MCINTCVWLSLQFMYIDLFPSMIIYIYTYLFLCICIYIVLFWTKNHDLISNPSEKGLINQANQRQTPFSWTWTWQQYLLPPPKKIERMSPNVRPFWKDMNHRPTINFLEIDMLVFSGGTVSNPSQETSKKYLMATHDGRCVAGSTSCLWKLHPRKTYDGDLFPLKRRLFSSPSDEKVSTERWEGFHHDEWWTRETTKKRSFNWNQWGVCDFLPPTNLWEKLWGTIWTFPIWTKQHQGAKYHATPGTFEHLASSPVATWGSLRIQDGNYLVPGPLAFFFSQREEGGVPGHGKCLQAHPGHVSECVCVCVCVLKCAGPRKIWLGICFVITWLSPFLVHMLSQENVGSLRQHASSP